MGKPQKNPAIPIQLAADLSGLSLHMVTYLGRLDILTPSEGGGRGRPRMYTFSDVLFLKVIADLLARGIEVKKLNAALKKAKAEAETWVDIRRAPRHYLVTDGTELFVSKKGRLESKTLNGQLAFAFVLDLAPAHRAIADAWPKEATNKRSRRA